MSDWRINTQTLESLGLVIAAGNFPSGRAASVTLKSIRDVDLSEIFSYGNPITITRDAAIFFRGKIREIPKSASPGSESHTYIVEDAWAELERTVYQEAWPTGATSVLLPEVILGVNTLGARITLGQQIQEVLTFAASSGIAIGGGSIPTGINLWPTRVTGMMCAEVIRTSLRFHPDWIPAINYAAATPTLSVTPAATANTVTLDITDLDQIPSITRRDDRVPNGVRIVFLTATTVDDDVYRDGTIQKFPTNCPDSGPGILTTSIELAGGSAMVQKQQIKTRPLPTSQSTAKNWLKLKYPWLKNIANEKFTVEEYDKTLLGDDEENPPELNTHAPRLYARSLNDVPNELIDGAVHEWMRKRVGKVTIKHKIKAVGATPEEKKIIESTPTETTITGTNAVTKIYKGRTQWRTIAEQAPTGLAQAYYQAIANGARYQGSVTLTSEDIGDMIFYNRKLNITGGDPGWANMNAPIYDVSWDLETRQTTISFGPNPELSIEDMMEYLKLLRDRKPDWVSTSERTSNTIGSERDPSAAGDAAGAKDGPETQPRFEGGSNFFHPFQITTTVEGQTPKYEVAKGSIQLGTNGAAAPISSLLETKKTAAANHVVLQANVDVNLETSGWALTLVDAATAAKEVEISTAAPIQQNKVRLHLGKLTLEDGVATAFQAQFSSVRLTHGLYNGLPVVIFEDAPTMPSVI